MTARLRRRRRGGAAAAIPAPADMRISPAGGRVCALLVRLLRVRCISLPCVVARAPGRQWVRSGAKQPPATIRRRRLRQWSSNRRSAALKLSLNGICAVTDAGLHTCPPEAAVTGRCLAGVRSRSRREQYEELARAAPARRFAGAAGWVWREKTAPFRNGGMLTTEPSPQLGRRRAHKYCAASRTAGAGGAICDSTGQAFAELSNGSARKETQTQCMCFITFFPL